MKILIIGAGVSAIAAYELATKQGDLSYLLLAKEETKNINNYNYYLNEELPNIIDNFDIFVISPGVFYDDERLLLIKKNHKKVYSEIEYAYTYLKSRPKIIAITGSNGKTTVVEGLYFILKKLNYDVIKAGNIGIPFSSVVTNIKDNDYLILELSNFQLDNLTNLKPDIAVITNITPNHLDHMKNYHHYLNSKLKIYKNMKEKDVLIYPKELNKYIDYKGIKVSIPIQDNHYLYNMEIVKTILKQLDINDYKNILDNFEGVPYRFQKINEHIYHDGKSTTPESTISAIKSINNENLIVIVGGKNKNLSFKDLLNQKVSKYIVYGDLINEIEDNDKFIKVATLREAINTFDNIKNSETILLYSPGCASFDQYNNYIERCEEFNILIKEKGYV